MSDTLKKLREQRAQTWEQAKALLDAATDAKRDLDADEEARWARLNDEIKALDERTDTILEAEERDARAETALREHAQRKPERRDDASDDALMGEVRSFLRGERREVTIAKDASFRDLLKGADATGGATVPRTLYGQLIEHMVDVSGLLQGGPTMIETSSGETIDIPVTTAYSSATLTAEAAAIAESDPAFAKRSLGAFKYAFLTQMSRELIDDSAFDLQGFLARQGGRGVGNAFGAHLVTGTGTNQPAGIATLATVGVTGGTGVTGKFTYENLVDLLYSVIAPYRSSTSASWLLKDQSLAEVRKLKDGSGAYIWQPSMQAGQPDLLLGKAIRTDPNVAAVGLNNASVLFGDVSAYFVRIAGGVRFERSDDFAFSNDLVTFKTVIRGDGLLADQTGAVKAFKGGAS